MHKYILGLALVLTISCTSTERASMMSYGKSGKITCYSGGQIIYAGESVGKIETVQNSDGWEFQEKETRVFIRVSGADFNTGETYPLRIYSRFVVND